MIKSKEDLNQYLDSLSPSELKDVFSLAKRKIAPNLSENQIIELGPNSFVEIVNIISEFGTKSCIKLFFQSLVSKKEVLEIENSSQGKKEYTQKIVDFINNTHCMEVAINNVFHEENFMDESGGEAAAREKLKAAVDAFNKTLNPNEYEMIKDGSSYKISKQGDFYSSIKQIVIGDKKPIIKSENMMSSQYDVDKEDCLVYDHSIKPHGLLWKELETWWESQPQSEGHELQKHLTKFLPENSPPQHFFWTKYFEIFKEKLGDELPALIPEVNIKYHSHSYEQRGESDVLQRADFILLLAGVVIIVEIDGSQHYSEKLKLNDFFYKKVKNIQEISEKLKEKNSCLDISTELQEICKVLEKLNIAAPKEYAKMVARDRELKFQGYEIYRIGGSELHKSNREPEKIVEDFFYNLFKKYKIN